MMHRQTQIKTDGLVTVNLMV